MTQRPARDFGERAGKLHARRSAPDDDKRQQAALFAGAGGALRRLERKQDPLPHLQRIVERLQSGRRCRPIVVAEVGVRRSSRKNQIVESDRVLVALVDSGFSRTVAPGFSRTLIEHDDPPDRIDRLRVGEEDFHVLLPAQDPSNRRCHVGRRQRGGRHLIEQRLKQMVVMAVDQRDTDGRVPQRLSGGQTTKSAAKNHNVIKPQV